MNSVLRARFRRYEKAVCKALMDEWDPVGVAEFPGAADEYDTYVPPICSLLMQGKGASEVFEYLWWLETEHMGLSGSRQVTERFAGRLVDLAREVESA